MPSDRANILVAYAMLNYPLRSAVEDHLYSFERFSRHRIFYANLALGGLPKRLSDTHFDLVIFHTSLLSARWTPWLWQQVTSRALAVPRGNETRVAMPQDEFFRARMVSDFIRDADVDTIFSVAPESEWAKIYPELDCGRVRFDRVLTGYLDERTLARIGRIIPPQADRAVTLGYRAWAAPPWLGRHGQLKVSVAEQLRKAAAARSLPVDISTRAEDVLLGDDWFRFLAGCRYQLGVEGGASILDRDGSLKERTEAYQGKHPSATFEEVEGACFPGRDGEISLFTLSPRHLEACATRTCQVLLEGTYNDILRPEVHYLELKRDLANLEGIVEAMQRDELRAEIVENAYCDIVTSGRYTYRSFVRHVERVALTSISRHDAPTDDHVLRISRRADHLSWRDVAVRAHAIAVASRALGPTVRRIRQARRARARGP